MLRIYGSRTLRDRFKTNTRRLKPFLFAFILVTLLFRLFWTLGITDPIWHGFGVDSAGRVYVGHGTDVHIYKNGKTTEVLPISHHDNFSLTVVDDRIRVAGGGETQLYSLDGTLQSTSPDPGNKLLKTLADKTYTTANGTSYKLRNVLGFYYLTASDGEIVFHRSFGDSLTALYFFFLAPILLFVFISLCLLLPAPSAKTADSKQDHS